MESIGMIKTERERQLFEKEYGVSYSENCGGLEWKTERERKKQRIKNDWDIFVSVLKMVVKEKK